MACAAKLRAPIRAVLEQGATQSALAKAAIVAPSTASRYLSGERVAPADFVEKFGTFL
ncbi:helix-turn-helix domain-containing protein [Streptomyces sp. NPDC002701]|uniref:helix-turn-helix domain-containing protein n=1 Tax=Streptomyces sp. NPDC002701 TaxID=3364661 RepID=UPI0036B62D06